jgi:glycosyltransferase involved in cell wall biosynthesis
MNTTISVVIPTYRRPELLIKCLNALSNQHFDTDKMELIVVSDGHDQATKNLMSKFPNVRYLTTAGKSGPATARNYGWLQAKGKLIAFTDDDCIPDNGWISSFVAHAGNDELLAMTGPYCCARFQKAYRLRT